MPTKPSAEVIYRHIDFFLNSERENSFHCYFELEFERQSKIEPWA